MTRLDYVKEKIVSLEEAKRRVSMWHMKNQKVVFTNGCFDILHAGHITYLAEAAEKGNKLIVAVNTDASVKALDKAPNRPVNEEKVRLLQVAALGFVDLVVLFDEPTPKETIEALLPDVLVKGGDYDATLTDASQKGYIVGSDLVRAKGGEVITIDLVDGFSTTGLIEKLKGN